MEGLGLVGGVLAEALEGLPRITDALRLLVHEALVELLLVHYTLRVHQPLSLPSLTSVAPAAAVGSLSLLVVLVLEGEGHPARVAGARTLLGCWVLLLLVR
jgi:hypothetical protein